MREEKDNYIVGCMPIDRASLLRKNTNLQLDI